MNYLQLLYEGRYDELVQETLPLLETDKEAERAFLRLFMQRPVVLLLCPHSTMQDLHDEADKGNKYAQYAVARRVCFEAAIENALWVSYRQMKAAADQGLPDAIAGLAMTYEFGDIGGVDRAQADLLMEQALEAGSELAKVYRLKEWCFGYRFMDAEPQKAEEMATRWIAEDEAKGIAPNGAWYYYRACAKEVQSGRLAAKEDYKKALESGMLAAYGDLIVSSGYGDTDDTLLENEEYHDYLLQGMAARYSGAFYLEGVRLMRRYATMDEKFDELDISMNNVSEDMLTKCHEAIHSLFSQAAHMGEVAAWEQVGDMYFEGTYGYEKSYEKAFTCYSNGVMRDSVSCMEKLWKMMHDHLIERHIDYVDQVALWGARKDNKRLLAETVIAKQDGRLSEFADEIEKYYEPVFLKEK
jgi:TPR repeat protein